MGYLSQNDNLDYTQFIHLPPDADSLLFAYDKSLFEKGQALKGTAAWDTLLQKLASIAHTGILFSEVPGLTISENSTPKHMPY